MTIKRVVHSLLLTERVQTGQDFGVVIVVQTNAADQKLLVYLPDHRAAAGGLTFGHGGGHSGGPFNLDRQDKRKKASSETVTLRPLRST